jgi:hypothetical protein
VTQHNLAVTQHRVNAHRLPGVHQRVERVSAGSGPRAPSIFRNKNRRYTGKIPVKTAAQKAKAPRARTEAPADRSGG